jgi:hypothetical protein
VAQGLGTLARNRTTAEEGIADFISSAALPEDLAQSIFDSDMEKPAAAGGGAGEATSVGTEFGRHLEALERRLEFAASAGSERVRGRKGGRDE